MFCKNLEKVAQLTGIPLQLYAWAYNLTKNSNPLEVFSGQFREIFENSYSIEHLWTAVLNEKTKH